MEQMLVASDMLAAYPDMERAEVVISIRADDKHRGIGWTLLDYGAEQAKARGIRVLEYLESRQNREASSLEQEKGSLPSLCPAMKPSFCCGAGSDGFTCKTAGRAGCNRPAPHFGCPNEQKSGLLRA